jgi:galactokinase
VPLSASVKIVVCNSGVKRALAQSEYQARVEQCRQAIAEMNAAGLEIRSLRDATTDQLASVAARMSEVPLRRARHVISENERVLDATRALQAGDLEAFGRLMNASHVSLRDDYAVSSRELDTLVELAWQQPGTLGARMTGAGFGGCTVNLVRREAAEAFGEAVLRGYADALGLKAEVYICQASDGALTEAG